ETEGFGGETILKDGRRRSLSVASDTKPPLQSSAATEFKPQAAKKRFELAIEKAGHKPATLSLEMGIVLMLAFYRDERAKGCSLDEAGNLLLFKWGITKQGKNELVEVDITRQLTDTDSAEAAMRQLSLRFHFPQKPGSPKIVASTRWCMTPA